MKNVISEHLQQEVLRDISLVLKDLLKIIKVLSLYPPDNPLPIKMRKSVGDQFVEVVSRYDGLRFDVQSDHLEYRKETVYYDKNKDEALAALFYNAGIILLEFKTGLSYEDFNIFLDLVRNYINDRSPDRDLVSSLWQEQFSHIYFRTVDDVALSEYNSDLAIRELFPDRLTDADDKAGVIYNQIILEDENRSEASFEGDEGGREGTTYIEFDDDDEPDEPSATLKDLPPLSQNAKDAIKQMGISLESPPKGKDPFSIYLNKGFAPAKEEQKEIRRLLESNRNFDPYRTVVRILLEILHLWKDQKSFFETVSICENVLDQLLSAGEFGVAADFVHSIRNLQIEVKAESNAFSNRLADFIRRSGESDCVDRLTEIINRQDGGDSSSIEIYLEALGWESLTNIVAMLGKLVTKDARLAVCEFLASHGRGHVNIIGSGIRDTKWYVVRNSVMILGKIGTDEILTYLKAAAQHSHKAVRIEIISALSRVASDEAGDILCTFLDDKDPDIRRRCLRQLEKRGGRKPFESLRETVDSDDFGNYALEEQEWYLIALSRLGGEEVVDYLASIIGSIRFLIPAHSIRFRLAALTALVHNRSDDAERVILKFSCSRRRWLREAASAALDQRRRLIYGGGNEDV